MSSVNLFDLSLKLNGFPIHKAKTLLKSIQHKNENDFKDYIESKKSEILEFHLRHNNFFKKYIKEADLSTWESIPILSKRDLQQPLEERLSNGYSKQNVYVNKTSGSSGDPFIFAKDRFCHALTWSVIQDRFGWYSIDFNKTRQARFYGIPLDKKGFYKERIKDFFSKRYRFSVFDLSDKAFDKVLNKFSSTPFEYINGYTSPIVQFAKYLERKKISLKSVCPTLKFCVVTSEMLFESDKELIKKQFGVLVIKEYGASELDLIAFENPNGQWQINSETLFVEILDENDKVLPYGKEGRIVITSLYNKAHPFIRYDIGDVGILSKKSSLKKPILKELIGRTNDIAILPSGKKSAGLTFYYITKSIIEDDGEIKEFIIEQHKPNLFKILYVSTEELEVKRKQEIIMEIERYLEKGVEVVFERREELVRSKSGKLKQFYSYLNQNA